jgi:hypothetical protein
MSLSGGIRLPLSGAAQCGKQTRHWLAAARSLFADCFSSELAVFNWYLDVEQPGVCSPVLLEERSGLLLGDGH